METITAFFGQAYHFFQTIFKPELLTHALQEWGWVAYVILFAIVFAETGLLVGFCLPGDSLLFIAGFVCSIRTDQGPVLNYFVLTALLCVAAVVGDTVGYWLGRRTGPLIFCREDSLFFHKKHLLRTQHFYERYGGRTIIYARFVPIVRTFAPFVAGIGRMDYPKFLSYNVFGGIGWVIGMTLIGYFLGSIPVVQRNLEKAVILVILISLMPIFYELIRAKLKKETVRVKEVESDGN